MVEPKIPNQAGKESRRKVLDYLTFRNCRRDGKQ